MPEIKERDVERAYKKFIEAMGGKSMKFKSPGLKGVSDRLNKLPIGPLFLIELKKPGEELDTLQKQFNSDMHEIGEYPGLVDRIDLALFISATVYASGVPASELFKMLPLNYRV